MQFTEEHVNKRFQAHRFLYCVTPICIVDHNLIEITSLTRSPLLIFMLVINCVVCPWNYEICLPFCFKLFLWWSLLLIQSDKIRSLSSSLYRKGMQFQLH
jgi:hypothetical protein